MLARDVLDILYQFRSSGRKLSVPLMMIRSLRALKMDIEIFSRLYISTGFINLPNIYAQSQNTMH